MKILYIANLRLPTEKAYGIQIIKTCQALVSQNVEVKLLYPYRKSKIKDSIFGYYGIGDSTFEVHRIYSLDFYWSGWWDKVSVSIKSFISALLLAGKALSSDANIIYSRDELPLFLLSLLGRQNLVFEIHRFSKRRKLFYWRFLRSRVKIVAISEELKKQLIKYGFLAERILVAHDGVDSSLFIKEESKAALRQELGLSSETKIALYSGHLFEQKGADSMAQAAILLPNWLFVFVGGTKFDAEEFRRRYAGQKNILIIGHVSHVKIPMYLHSADVLVIPTKDDGNDAGLYASPLKVFEYLASGRPIVASDIKSLREILNENNAFFFEADNPEALAQAIKKIDESGIDFIANNQEKAKQYDWSVRAAKIINFLNLR